MSVLTEARVLPRIEQNTRLLTGQILPDDPLRPHRTQIQYTLGSRELVLSLPKTQTNGDNKSHLYFHGGIGHQGVLPDITEGKEGEERFVVDFESGKRDAEFTLSQGAEMTINLRGINNRIRAHVEMRADSTKELVISAEGERNRWFKIKRGKADELHAYGNDPGTDDDLRVVIDRDGSVGQLHLYDHAAAHTPETDKLGDYIDELHAHGEAFLNDIKLQPGNTLSDMPRLIALGRERSRRAVHPDVFHPSTPEVRRKFDDPFEKTLAEQEAEREAERQRREKILVERQIWARQQDTMPARPKALPDWYYTGIREKKQPIRTLLRRLASGQRSSVESQETRADHHISLMPVDSENKFLGTIVRNAFYKAKVDYTDYEMQAALALAMVANDTNNPPPVGKRAYILSDDALRLLGEREKYPTLRILLREFVEGNHANSGKGVTTHVSEIARRKWEGWQVIDELDDLVMQELERRVAQANSLPDSDNSVVSLATQKADLVEHQSKIAFYISAIDNYVL